VVSLLNGLGGLGSGLGTFAVDALKDQVNDADRTARTPLLSAAPPPADPIVAAAPPAAGSTAVAGVPPDLLPIYQAASKRTGIPVDVLIAQGKQESGFNPNAVGSAGEIGLHQIKPSTGRDPGFGMRGIDPATLKDPTVNINFAADYLKARAGEAANLSNPADVDRALAAYNGGGNPNYVANVRQHLTPAGPRVGAVPPVAVAPVAGQSADEAWLDNLAKTYPDLAAKPTASTPNNQRPSPYTGGRIPAPGQDATFGSWQDIPTQQDRAPFTGAIPQPPSNYGSTALQTPHSYYGALDFMRQSGATPADIARLAPLLRVGLMNRNQT
jgi:hypothetical protein